MSPGKTWARQARSERGGKGPVLGRRAVWVDRRVVPFGRPTRRPLTTGARFSHGVVGEMKWLVQPVSAMALVDVGAGTKGEK